MKEYLLNKSIDDIKIAVKELGQPEFRAKQIFEWLHKGAEFSEMTNLTKEFQTLLDEKYGTNPVIIQKKLISSDGTIKYLFLLPDSNIIEGVLMKYRHGNTICISSQVGCKMGCAFCASTIGGIVRNLDAGEMLGQVIAVNKDAGGGRTISNIVIMGSGEPLDNYDELMRFLRLVNHPTGINIGARNIAVSTCGLTEGIYKLAEENLQVNLALSLHAPTDEIRMSLMPIAKKYNIKEVIKALKSYINSTGRRVTIEYAMIKDVNDSLANAIQLHRLLAGLICHVNLIPLNAVEGKMLLPSPKDKIDQFETYLREKGVSVTVRRELGSDISGACGQLRRDHLDSGG